MAAWERRRATNGYETYGSMAYAPGYDGTAARELPQEHVFQPRPKVRPRERERVLERPQVQVREAGRVSLFAVAGFLAVGIFAALVLFSYVRLTVVGDETIHLRSQLSELQSEEAKLMARYELAYDLKAIEADFTASGAMVKPQSSQVYVINLSEPDAVEYFRENGMEMASEGTAEKLKQVFSYAVEYFR